MVLIYPRPVSPPIVLLQYDWEGGSHLWDALRSDYIDWRYTALDTKGNDTLTMDYVAEHNNETEYYNYFVNQACHGKIFELSAQCHFIHHRCVPCSTL